MSSETNLIKMQECQKDYSSYMMWMQNQKNQYTFICGFTFTTLTLLIINLPNTINIIIAQSIMLFLTIVFDLLLFLVLLIGVESLQYCKNIPPYTKASHLCQNLSNIVFPLWGFSVPLIYLLWDFIYLAVVSAIIWILLMVVSNFTVRKPLKQYRRVTEIKGDK